MDKTIVFLFFLTSVITIVTATNTIYIGEYWKAGNTEEIKIDTDIVYDTARVYISDSNDDLVLNSSMYKKNNNLWLLDYYMPANTKKDTYTIEVVLERRFGGTEKRIIEVEVRELNIFERFLLFIKTYFGLFR